MTVRRACSMVLGWVGLFGVIVLPANAQAPTVRDSAGIRIVENGPRASAPVTFRLASKPRLEVGGLEADPDLEFDHNQGYLRAALLPDGGLAVIDVWRVHFFSANGTRRAVVGRKGAGPNEFRYLMGICRTRGDTLVVYDSHNKRVTLLTSAGRVASAFQVEPNWSTGFDSCYADGTLHFSRMVPAAATDSVQPVELFRTRLDGSKVGRDLSFTSRKFDMITSSGAIYTAGGAHLLYVDARDNQIRLYDAQGKLARIVRTADPILPVTNEQAEARMLGSIPRDVPAAERQQRIDLMRSRGHAASWPGYEMLQSDPAGRIWALDKFMVSGQQLAWTAFDAEGRLLGRLALSPLPGEQRPPQVIAFGDDAVLVRRRDSDGAAYLSLFPLERVSATRR